MSPPELARTKARQIRRYLDPRVDPKAAAESALLIICDEGDDRLERALLWLWETIWTARFQASTARPKRPHRSGCSCYTCIASERQLALFEGQS